MYPPHTGAIVIMSANPIISITPWLSVAYSCQPMCPLSSLSTRPRMTVDRLPEAVTVTVFMEGLRTGVTRTEVFRTRPTSFEEAMNVALNAEFNFKSSRLGWNASYANPLSGPEPTDLSYAEDGEAELLAAEQRRGIRRCFVCDDTRHLRAGCPVRKLRQAPSRRKPCFGPEHCFVSGKREVPVGAGRPTGEELSSAEPHGGGGQQGLAPTRAALSNTERVCKPGLLVVQATAKGFERPWTILIDPGLARDRDIVTVGLATGPRVTVSKVPVDLGMKFLDFDSVERCLVLDPDARYDLILGMAWLERHEPWIDWRSTTLGATHFSPSGALASHEPTSA
ncbi:unnamed protein product [Phytophthora fragariaefolia]|uniref:Unnamed protein product n=1 Tax=Phytophthora fragariaefolia TaxID=1490495 RepID=A0A9W6TNC0_9STRA|nr:unnamed protein product [Phytophthora fragariaefolia]